MDVEVVKKICEKIEFLLSDFYKEENMLPFPQQEQLLGLKLPLVFPSREIDIQK